MPAFPVMRERCARAASGGRVLRCMRSCGGRVMRGARGVARRAEAVGNGIASAVTTNAFPDP